MKRVFNWRKQHYRPIVSIFLIMLITVTLVGGMVGCGGGPIKIYDWYQLHRVRDNLGGSYILMNDLNLTHYGYVDRAGASANG